MELNPPEGGPGIKLDSSALLTAITGGSACTFCCSAAYTAFDSIVGSWPDLTLDATSFPRFEAAFKRGDVYLNRMLNKEGASLNYEENFDFSQFCVDLKLN